jgi:acetolactate synthase-1/2/3 large subunit
MTLMGLGAYPGDEPLSLDMLGMHGSVYANYAVDEADLLIAVGVRFDDRVTGKVSSSPGTASLCTSISIHLRSTRTSWCTCRLWLT